MGKKPLPRLGRAAAPRGDSIKAIDRLRRKAVQRGVTIPSRSRGDFPRVSDTLCTIRMNRPLTYCTTATFACCLLAGGCNRDQAAARGPVLYCSIDEEFARTILARFESQTGIRPEVLFDSEAGKTTGLVIKIIDEQQSGRRRADVFWSSELFNTIALARRGLLEPYDPPTAADIPQRYRDTEHRWTALAVRGRVLAFDPKQVEAGQVPSRWDQLAGPGLANRTALANPLFGTTRGHVAAMFALWGPEKGRQFLNDLRTNGVLIVDGNSTAVRTLMDNRMAFAATDTDDVWVAQQRGASMDLRYLDMGDGGTLLVPCSVALIKGSDKQHVRKLIDYLVSAEVERMLAESTSRNIPVRPRLREELGLAWPPETRVEFDAIVDSMDEAVAAVREILIR